MDLCCTSRCSNPPKCLGPTRPCQFLSKGLLPRAKSAKHFGSELEFAVVFQLGTCLSFQYGPGAPPPCISLSKIEDLLSVLENQRRAGLHRLGGEGTAGFFERQDLAACYLKMSQTSYPRP